MMADALVPCIAGPSVTMELIMQDKWVIFFHEERFQPHVLSQR